MLSALIKYVLLVIAAAWILNVVSPSKTDTYKLHMDSRKMTNEEIADKLELSKRTVDNQRQNTLKKLNAKNSMGLVLAAIKIGLINISSKKGKSIKEPS